MSTEGKPRRRVVGGALSVALGLGLVVAPPPAATTAASARHRGRRPNRPRTPRRCGEAEALAKAKRTGRDVEIVSLRAESSEVYATPDGKLEAREHLRPVRARVDGAWTRAPARARPTARRRSAPPNCAAVSPSAWPAPRGTRRRSTVSTTTRSPTSPPWTPRPGSPSRHGRSCRRCRTTRRSSRRSPVDDRRRVRRPDRRQLLGPGLRLGRPAHPADQHHALLPAVHRRQLHGGPRAALVQQVRRHLRHRHRPHRRRARPGHPVRVPGRSRLALRR